MSIIKLETENQEQACEYINELYRQAITHKSTRAINQLKKIYQNNWQTIKERMETEGSTWYVWYMDGVNTLLSNQK